MNNAPAMTSRIRILIVDDHPMLREGAPAVIQMQPDMDFVRGGA